MTTETQDNLTAHAGGGQKDATPILAGNNDFTTVAKPGDSGVLPKVVLGQICTVHNKTTTSMNVFPAPGHTLDAQEPDKELAVVGGATLHFTGVTATNWKSK